MPVRKLIPVLCLGLLLLAGCGREQVTVPAVLELPSPTPVPPTATLFLPPTWTPSPTLPPTCDVVIRQAAAAAVSTCLGAGIGEACLAAGPVRVDPASDQAPPVFAAPGDRMALGAARGLTTNTYDPSALSYSIAVLKIQADPPPIAPGQWITAVQYGDVTVSDTLQGRTPFQQLTVRTGFEDPACPQAPLPAVLFHNATGQDAELTINGLIVRFFGTMLVRAQANGQMHLVMLNGHAAAQLDPAVAPFNVPGGGELHTPLGGDLGLTAQGPLTLHPLNTLQIAFVPLTVLPEPVAVGPPLQLSQVSAANATPDATEVSLGPTEEPTATPAAPFQGTPENPNQTYSGQRITPGQTVVGTVPAGGRDRWVFVPVGLGPDSFDSFEVVAIGSWDPVITIESATWGVYEADFDTSPGTVEVYTASLAGNDGDWRIVIRDSQGGGGGYQLRYTCQGPCPGQ